MLIEIQVQRRIPNPDPEEATRKPVIAAPGMRLWVNTDHVVSIIPDGPTDDTGAALWYSVRTTAGDGFRVDNSTAHYLGMRSERRD